jgi:hypothetical protein
MTCWEYNSCPKDKYEKCPAYPQNGHDCWTVTGRKYGCGKNEAPSFFEKLFFCKNSCDFFKTYIRQF